MLNEDNEGKEVNGDDEARTAGLPRHQASATSKHGWCSALSDVKRWLYSSKNIDWLSLRIFPASFLLFNIVYWSVYLSPPHYHCDHGAHLIDVSCFTTHGPIFY